MKTKNLIYGVGLNDMDTIKVNGKNLPFYDTWHNMLNRCYSKACQLRQPTYIGCTVCTDWLILSRFKDWYDSNYINSYALDKDLLNNGNKVYSADNCRYVPQGLNSLLTDAGAIRGEFDIGISFDKRNNKYRARCSVPPIISGRVDTYRHHIGMFSTHGQAYDAYKSYKSKLIIQIAFVYYNTLMIEKDILNALIDHANKLKVS